MDTVAGPYTMELFEVASFEVVVGVVGAGITSTNIVFTEDATVLGTVPGGSNITTIKLRTLTNTIALGKGLYATSDQQAVFGQYNEGVATNVIEVGNGVDDGHRSNSFSVDNAGILRAKGLVLPACTTAERPTPPTLGLYVLDTTLGYAICYNGTNWVNGVGATV
jgi:hypothetical protein